VRTLTNLCIFITEKQEREKGQVNEINQIHNTKVFSEIFAKGDLARASEWLQSGGDINGKDEEESIPLHIAAYNGYNDLVELLLQYKSDINAIDKNGQTPLHLAAMKGHLDVVKTLVAAGSDIDAIDLESQTPGDWASLMGKNDVASFLASPNN
jgi:ankyrin repeat protein